MALLRRLSAGLASIFVAGCAADNAIGPSGSPLLASEASAAKSNAPKNPTVYCVNPTSCFAVAIDFKKRVNDPLLGRTTLVSVYFQNLQGTFPEDGPSTPLKLRTFGFVFFGTQESASFVDAYPIETFGSVGNVEQGAQNGWGNDSPAAGRNRDNWLADLGSGILGCDINPMEPARFFTFRTCPRDGLDGWVRVDFILRRAGLDPDKKPIGLEDFEFWFGTAFPFQSCVIGAPQVSTCTVFPYDEVVSP